MCEPVLSMCNDTGIWKSRVTCGMLTMFACVAALVYGLVVGLWAAPELEVTSYVSCSCLITGKEQQVKLCNHTYCYRPAVFVVELGDGVHGNCKWGNISTVIYNSVTGTWYHRTFGRYLAQFIVGTVRTCYVNPKDPYIAVWSKKLPIGPLLCVIFLGLLPLAVLCLCTRMACAFVFQNDYDEWRCPCRCRSSSRSRLTRATASSSTSGAGRYGALVDPEVAAARVSAAHVNAPPPPSFQPSAPPPSFQPAPVVPASAPAPPPYTYVETHKDEFVVKS